MTDQLIIIPKPPQEVRPAPQSEWWQRMEDRWNPPFELSNVHFHYYHDDFFNRHLSVRAARDWKNHPFWFYICILFFIGQMAAAGIGLSFRIIKPFIPEIDLPDFS